MKKMRKSMFVFYTLLSIGLLGLSLSLFSKPVAASPRLAFTETFTPTPTDTPLPSLTPTPTSLPITSTPTATATGVGGPQPTTPPGPLVGDPLITKAVNLTQAQPGDTVIFTLVVTNPNSIDLPNVVVVDPLSALVDFVSATTPQGAFVYDPNAHTLTFQLGALTPGQVIIITIHTRVNPNAQPPDQITNTVTMLSNGSPVDESNTTVTVLVPEAFPGAGFGPGPIERAIMFLAGSLVVTGLLWLGRRMIYRPARHT